MLWTVVYHELTFKPYYCSWHKLRNGFSSRASIWCKFIKILHFKFFYFRTYLYRWRRFQFQGYKLTILPSVLSTPLVSSPWSSSLLKMTSTIDPKTIGKPARTRRHVRTLTGMCFTTTIIHNRVHRSRLLIFVVTGYLPEKDVSGKEKWPRGEEKVWREGMRTIDKSLLTIFCCSPFSYWHLRKCRCWSGHKIFC